MAKKQRTKSKSIKNMSAKQLEAMINKQLKKTRKNKKNDKVAKGIAAAANAAYVGKFLGEALK